MINLIRTRFILYRYTNQKELEIKLTTYALGVVVIFEIIRGQSAEVNLLQLVPGLYLFLLFIFLVFVIFISYFFSKLSIQAEILKPAGVKSIKKFNFIILNKTRFFLFFTILLLALNTAVPLSLDSFNTYGEKSLENIWSFGEVLSLEIIILGILLVLSQVPIVVLPVLFNEKPLLYIAEYSKSISFAILIISGFLTPTIDGYTQISFAVSIFYLYLIILNTLQKRISLKNNLFSLLAS